MAPRKMSDLTNRRFSVGGAEPEKWLKVKAIKLRRDPICQVRVKCNGAAATEISHYTPVSVGGSPFDLDDLQSACRACQAWKLSVANLRVHP